MAELTSSNGAFLIPGIISLLLLIGVFLRNVIPLFKKILLPASIIAGVIGFIIMNTGIIPIKQSVFENLAFHLTNLSFMSITLSSVRKATGVVRKKDKAFRGGAWLAAMWGALFSIQVVVGGILGVVLNKVGFSDFSGELGTLNASAFAQGPGQALAIGRTWETLGIAGAAQIGLFYAAVGFLVASLIGVPICNILFKKKLTTFERKEQDIEMSKGIYARETKKKLGNQTTHRSSIDTLTTHLAVLFGTYLLTYILVTFLCEFIPNQEGKDSMYNMMFIWSIIVASIVKPTMQKLNCDYLIDPEVQTSITNCLTDVLLVACMMSVSIGLISKLIVPLLMVCIVITIVTALVSFIMAKRTGEFFAERMVTIFGFCTGTAVTGMLLLRVVDPTYKTSVAKEIVWWNILQMFAGLVVATAAALPTMGLMTWMIINIVVSILYLAIAFVIGENMSGKLSIKKRDKEEVA